MSRIAIVLLAACWGLAGVPSATTQEPAGTPPPSFDDATRDLEEQARESVRRLAELRERLAAEKLPLSRRLRELESELSAARADFQQATRRLDRGTLDLTNLRGDIERAEADATHLSSLLVDYVRNFESGLHVSERQLYRDAVETAKLAPENTNLAQGEVFDAQARLLALSLDRLHDAIGSRRFEGRAVGADGLVDEGTFVLVGPVAIFHAADGSDVGTVEQRIDSVEPSVFRFPEARDAAAAAELATTGEGLFPFDPTKGNAHKIAATEETFVEHVKKGGAVMIPIFAMAAAALLVALYKWLTLTLTRKPSEREIGELLATVGAGDEGEALERARAIRGPVGRMLEKGAESLRHPRELIEEVMYETVLKTRLKLQSFLPFIAICAASAPLLGLLGTVTGIIRTFKLLTVYGSGDVKGLSSGISEALITTKFGLVVAIPSLLLHAFLSRKARGVVDQMEKAALAFVNEVGKSRSERGVADDMRAGEDDPEPATVAPAPSGRPGGSPPVDPDLVREHVEAALGRILRPAVQESLEHDAGGRAPRAERRPPAPPRAVGAGRAREER